MTNEKTISAHAYKSDAAEDQEERVTAASPLLDQAKGFAQVARDAVNDCQRGDDAVKELQRRRNRSGQ